MVGLFEGALATTRCSRPRIFGPKGRSWAPRTHTIKKAPAEAGAFVNRSAGQSEVALDAQTSAPLVLLARRERACLSDRREDARRDDCETGALVQVGDR